MGGKKRLARRKPALRRSLFFATLVLCVATTAQAKLDTAVCVACHNAFPPRAGKNLHVDASLFKSSVHAALGCQSCHSDVTAIPHQRPPQEVSCGGCHPTQDSAYRRSVHASLGTRRAIPGCLDCHGNPHEIVPVRDPRSPVYPLSLPRTCGSCHGSPELAKRYGFPDVYALYMDSIHGFALTKDGLLVAAQCSSCHGSHEILSRKDPRSRTARGNIPATCGSCHTGVKAAYLEGVHGKALAAGNPGAPVCADCHTAHRIAEVRTVAWQVGTVGTCGACHKERLRTYRDTFHGQVTALGFSETARCWSCHGSHAIFPASDARSSIAPANLQATCGKCHAGATKSFVSYQPHADPSNRKLNPVLYFAALFMNLLMVGVFMFFGIHTVLWLFRSLFDHKPDDSGPGRGGSKPANRGGAR